MAGGGHEAQARASANRDGSSPGSVSSPVKETVRLTVPLGPPRSSPLILLSFHFKGKIILAGTYRAFTTSRALH